MTLPITWWRQQLATERRPEGVEMNHPNSVTEDQGVWLEGSDCMGDMYRLFLALDPKQPQTVMAIGDPDFDEDGTMCDYVYRFCFTDMNLLKALALLERKRSEREVISKTSELDDLIEPDQS